MSDKVPDWAIEMAREVGVAGHLPTVHLRIARALLYAYSMGEAKADARINALLQSLHAADVVVSAAAAGEKAADAYIKSLEEIIEQLGGAELIQAIRRLGEAE